MIAGPGMSHAHCALTGVSLSYCILPCFLLIFVVNYNSAYCSSYWPLLAAAACVGDLQVVPCCEVWRYVQLTTISSVLSKSKFPIPNSVVLNIYCCLHSTGHGQTSPGPEPAIRRSTAHLSSCHLQPNKESHNMVIGDINGILSSDIDILTFWIHSTITFPL